MIIQEDIQDMHLHNTDWCKEFEKRMKSVVDYANFLKQPLTLGMFIPCDKEGNVLEEPDCKEDYYRDANGLAYNYFEDRKKWLEAKERVLFEGFEIIKSKHKGKRIKKEHIEMAFYNDYVKIDYIDSSFKNNRRPNRIRIKIN